MIEQQVHFFNEKHLLSAGITSKVLMQGAQPPCMNGVLRRYFCSGFCLKLEVFCRTLFCSQGRLLTPLASPDFKKETNVTNRRSGSFTVKVGPSFARLTSRRSINRKRGSVSYQVPTVPSKKSQKLCFPTAQFTTKDSRELSVSRINGHFFHKTIRM